jgi:catechol 2,3-dioxygenase-like lactoylglutathione lyase family enzyme
VAIDDRFELGRQPIIAFVPTRDAERARKFYGETLGLRLVLDQLPFALGFDVNGITLRVTPVKELNPPVFTVLGWWVPDISAAAKSLEKAGVRFEDIRVSNRTNWESGRRRAATPRSPGSETRMAIHWHLAALKTNVGQPCQAPSALPGVVTPNSPLYGITTALFSADINCPSESLTTSRTI